MKLRDWRMRLSHGWVGFWGWFRDNFIIIAAVLLFLWLLVVWRAFTRGLLEVEIFTAYAMYGTATGTGLLAIATFVMARKNSQLTELTRLSLEKPVIGELIVYAIEPVESQIKQDADALQADGVYLMDLYDISLPHATTNTFPSTWYHMERTFLGDIFARYPHYMELIQRYPDLYGYLRDYIIQVWEAQRLIKQAADDIQACLKESRLTKAVNAFPPNSKIPLKYLPLWESLYASGRKVPRPDYDSYHLWSSELESFWQNYKEEIMKLISSTSIPNLIMDINKALKKCEGILARKAERLSKVKEELKARYLFTEKELESLREQFQKEKHS